MCRIDLDAQTVLAHHSGARLRRGVHVLALSRGPRSLKRWVAVLVLTLTCLALAKQARVRMTLDQPLTLKPDLKVTWSEVKLEEGQAWLRLDFVQGEEIESWKLLAPEQDARPHFDFQGVRFMLIDHSLEESKARWLELGLSRAPE